MSTAFLTWAVCAVYTLRFNPENVFLTTAAHIKQNWSHRITREHGNKIVVFGGSSCFLSIDGERMEERHRLALVNMGLFAGCGAKTLTEWALSEVRPEDTLVVSLEPGLLTERVEPTAAGIQFCYAMHSPQWIGGTLEPLAPIGPGSLLALRPGGYHACTLMGKIFQHRPMFRYAVAEIHPSGWVETPVRRGDFAAPGRGQNISPSARVLLRSLSEWCSTNRVRLCYSLPMAWCPTEQLEKFQRGNASFLLEISELLPVLEDRRLGGNTNLDLYADTAWHLNATGVALRTDELAAQLRAWRMWKPEELRAIVQSGF